MVAFWPWVWTSQCLGLPEFRLVLLRAFRIFFNVFNRFVKHNFYLLLRKLNFWVLKHLSFSKGSILLPASAEAQPSGLLSFHGLSKKGPAFLHSFQIKGNIISLQSIPVSSCLPAPLSHYHSLQGGVIGTQVTGGTGSPWTRVAVEVFCTVNQKIMPKFPIPNKSCLFWWYRLPNISDGRPLNPGSSRGNLFDPLSLICTAGMKGIKGIKM